MLKLEQFEKKIHVRQITLDDYDEIVRLQLECFPGMKPWLKAQIESQTKVFPEGQICVVYDNRIVASSCSLAVDFGDYESWHNWKEIADNGYIRNHDPEGDTLYGIEIMVSPNYRGLKLARRLYDARKEVARQLNLRRIMIGGRIPGYGKVADKMTAREYVEEVMSKKLFDPVLTVQLSNGFDLKQLIPNYLPADEESRGYATFLEWTNLDRAEDPGGGRRFRATAPVRICVVQYLLRRVKSFEEFSWQCEFYVDAASAYKSDFVVFPELMTVQLLALAEGLRPGLAARALAEYTSQYLELFSKLSIQYDVNIVAGSQFTVEDGDLYNVSYLFQRDGTIGKQYKLHISPSEIKWWGVSGGSAVKVFDTDRGKVAILIGYDIEFPELARVARAKGANILFVPFDSDERHSYLRVRYCAQARAIENQMFVAISGSTGALPFIDNADIHYAQSAIFTPSDFPFARDAVAAEAPPNIENILLQDVDTELLRRNRIDGTARPWGDRRKELYRIQYDDPDDGQIEI